MESPGLGWTGLVVWTTPNPWPSPCIELNSVHGSGRRMSVAPKFIYFFLLNNPKIFNIKGLSTRPLTRSVTAWPSARGPSWEI